MESDESIRSVEFGRTRISYTVGEATEQPVQAVICAANSRGIMLASGRFSLRFTAGPEVEREAMSLAPLEIGSAVLTSPGKLRASGVERLVHATISPEPGAAVKLPDVRVALAAALELVHVERISSVAIPMLGLATDANGQQRQQWIEAIVDEVVAHVRRDRSRLDLVVLVSRYPDDQAVIGAALANARTHSWRS